MSYFKNNTAHVIVPTADLTEEMLNNVRISFNVTGDIESNSLRKSVDGFLCLLKIKLPISTVFNGYRWYNDKDIIDFLTDNSDWEIDV